MPGLLINGVDSEALGLTLGEAPGWLDMPPRDIPTAPIIGRQGAAQLADPVEQPRRLSLTGTVRATTPAVLRTKIDSLKLALAATPLDLIFSDNSSRRVRAKLTSFTTKSVSSGSFVMEALSVEAVLTALDPYSYDTALAGVFIIENLVIQSENFGTTWVADGTPTRTPGATVVNGISLDQIGDDDAAAVEGYHETITFASDGIKGISLHVFQRTSTSSVIRLIDNSIPLNRLLAVLTWSGGLPVVTMSAGTYFGYDSLGSGVFRIKLGTASSVDRTHANELGIYPATPFPFDVATTGSIDVGGVQVENNTPPGVYVKTTTTAVARLGLPLGTAPVRPVVTISGAAVNPVITLYNKFGAAVASITLTITTVGGDTLVIDMDAKTVKKNGASQIATITAGDFFAIDPADQANFGDPGPAIASSSGAITVAYNRTWR